MQHLLPFIHQLQRTSILCVGDVMLDLFVYGHVTRISPEAPIPILKVDREFHTLGGAGNVVSNLLALGTKPHLIGFIGKDQNGAKVKKLLSDKGVSPGDLIESPVQTTEKKRFSTKTQQLLRVDYEEQQFFEPSFYRALMSRVQALLPSISVIVLSDYGKGVLHPAHVLEPLIRCAQERGIPIVVDPKGADYSIYRGATLVTPNRAELTEATQKPAQTDEEIRDAAAIILKTCGIDNVLVTRSEDGMSLIQKGRAPAHYRVKATEVYDVSGAGDTVVAVMAAGLGSRVSLDISCQLANIAGSIVVGKIGTATVSHLELAEHCCETESSDDTRKIMSLEQILEAVHSWRKKGLKVGITNGCFDVLHQGHMHILREAKKSCGKLIVGVNSDASVRRLKGKSRPINDENTRIELMACLQFVDAVVLFDEDTPEKLITAIIPDVLAKGADYTIDRVVGSDVVQKNGGQVILIDLKPGKSSTSTIAKMLDTCFKENDEELKEFK